MQQEHKKLFILVFPISILAITLFLFQNRLQEDSNSSLSETDSKQTLVDELDGNSDSATSSTQNSDNNNSSQSGSISQDSTDDSSPTSTSITTNTDADLVLAVNKYRCIGCGRCAQLDSSHFKIINKTASVVSQENLDSAQLERAIENCPADAITLS